MLIAIVDDISAESDEIKEILHSIAVKQCMTSDISYFESGELFLNDFKNNAFDIIFMDIYMNGITGMETAKEIRRTDKHCLLIFLTTSMEHMLEAFSCNDFEYIQKPVNEERVIMVITNALHILPTETQYIKFTSNRQTVRLLYSDFVATVSADHYLNITDCNNKIYKIRQTLSEFTKSLEKDSRFLQINKGIVVNMNHIFSIEDNTCTMKNGQTFPVKVRDSLKIKKIWCQYGFHHIHNDQKRRRQ
ncbi:MAG: LytTR family DNA-binding domain-containing protein [Ruminococcus sp.]|nr:LytTR family DNA-binding domain-containing protein [Ruminococcus sp.]MDE6849382.1 LytTR family DNA-binding domain-containing protein [Ruminococcus sp.]